MKTMVIAAAAICAVSGAAQAAVTDFEFLKAARCRGLAGSEGLGKLDTSALDAFLREQGAARPGPVRVSASNKIAAAAKEGDQAVGAKKDKLAAERADQCAAWLTPTSLAKG